MSNYFELTRLLDEHVEDELSLAQRCAYAIQRRDHDLGTRTTDIVLRRLTELYVNVVVEQAVEADCACQVLELQPLSANSVRVAGQIRPSYACPVAQLEAVERQAERLADESLQL